jgi:transposase
MALSKEEVRKTNSGYRKRSWAPAQKKSIVEETYGPGMTLSYVARKHGISPSLLCSWRRHMEEGALTGINHEQKVIPEFEVKKLEARVRELERVLGKKTLENEILREAIRIGREKKLISRSPLLGVDNLE